MALIKCKDCGKMISNEANCCPNCGRPTAIYKEEKPSTASYIIFTIIGLFIPLILLIASIIYFINASRSSGYSSTYLKNGIVNIILFFITMFAYSNLSL